MTAVSKNTKTGEVDFTSCTYKWVISDYKSYDNLSTGSFLESPTFNAVNVEWYLRLYPNGDREESKGYLSLFLCRQSSSNLQARILWTVLDSNEEFFKTSDTKRMVDFNDSKAWGSIKFVKKNEVTEQLDTVLNDGVLAILCEIRVDNESIHQALTSNHLSRLNHFYKFERLVNDKKFSDVKFIVEDQELHAHKNIITANSEVFAAMLEHNMKESQENTIKIEDISYPVMYELLRFMYSGKIDGIERIASELFVAADKYKLLDLKDVCERQLCKDLSIYNVIDYINLADLYSAEKLKTEAKAFIVAHGKEMVDLTEFSMIATLNESSLVDIFRALFLREENNTNGVSENK